MSRKWNSWKALTVGGAVALSSFAYAQPQTQVPVIATSQSTSTAPAGRFVYDGSGGIYTVDSGADTFEAVLGQPRNIVNTSPPGTTRNDRLQITVEILDDAGNAAVGGNANGPDYVLTGSIDLDGNGTIDVSGVLLTAEFEELISFSGTAGFTGLIDMRFTPTGGQLVDLGYYDGRSLFVSQTLEFQTFNGDFSLPFIAGDVKAGTTTQSAYGNGTADIGDKVFYDLNGNGMQEPNEPGIAGVRVLLTDSNGDVVSIAFTDSNGIYTFRDVTDGDYTIQADANTIPPNFSPTVANAGNDDNRDSDSVNGAPFSVTVNVVNDFSFDMGYVATGSGSIGDTIFRDVDRDGVQDAGEPGIQGVTVTLTDSNGVVTTTMTGPNGMYLFPGLVADTYSVDVVEATLPPGLAPTTPNQGGNPALDSNFPLNGDPVSVTLPNNNSNDLTIDGGYVTPATGSIGDFIFVDQNGNGIQDPDELDDGITGVTVKLVQNGVTLETTTTGANGFYEFTGLPAGDYIVMVVDGPGTPLADLTPSPAEQGGDPATDSNGVNGMAPVTLDNDSDTDPTVDFGYVPPAEGRLGDYVFFDEDRDGIQDPDENGIANVTVLLLDENGNQIASDITDLNGAYLFTGLAAGDYQVQINNGTLPTGFTPTITDVNGNNNDALDSDGPQDGSAVAVNLPVNDSENLTIDFGFVAPAEGRLGNFVFLDTDNDGIQDAGEPGLEGITVELRDSNGTLVQSQETDTDGGYLFEGLLAGTYTVDVNDSDLPAGYSPTITDVNGNANDALDSDGPQDGGAVTVTLPTDSSEDLTIDFGYVTPEEGRLGNFVFNDFDEDGIQDAGEEGIAGIRVELRDPITMDLIASTVTEADGFYDFNGLAAGDYKIIVIPPADAVMSPANQGVDDAIDSDENGVIANLPSNQTEDFTYDFGFYFPELGRIGDFVWFDENANGIQDNGEDGIPGVTVELRDNTGTLLATDVTGAFGDYIFEMLSAGTYRVDVLEGTLPAGYVLSPTDAGGNDEVDSDGPQDDGFVEVTLQLNNDEDLTIDFGYNRPAGGAIGDTIFNDINGDGDQDANEPGLEGAVVVLIDKDTGTVLDTQVVGPNGQYLFDNLPAGNYTIQVTPPADFVGTADPDGTIDNMTMLTLGVNETNLDQDFGYNQPNGRLGDFVWLDSNANGVQDAGENGIANVTVNLIQNGQVIATQQTGGQGDYLFDGLTAGTYQVDVVETTLPAGLNETTQNAGGNDATDSDVNANGDPVTVVLADDNSEDLTIDFGYVGTGSIGDTIWNDLDGDGVLDANEDGIAGVTVKLLDAAGNVLETTVTDGNGNYSFDNLPAGDYVVMVDPATVPAGLAPTFELDGNFDGMTPVTLAAGETNNDVDFGYQPNGAIGDRVFEDLNGNGQQDAGEPGIPGVTVNLLNAAGNVIATDTTDANGNYLFEGLAAGDYGVDFIEPAGFIPTAPNVGNDATDSDNPLNSAPVAVTLGNAQVNLTIDAGLVRLAALGDKVFVDSDNDGVQDNNEPGVPGVTVELLDAAGNVLATQTTDNNGLYLFGNLTPGAYRVRFTAPNGFDFTTANVGGDDSIDSDADTVTGLSPLVALLSGQTDLTVDAGIVDAGNPNVCNNPVDIDFSGLPRGTIVDDEYAAFGITVSTNNANRPAMIFDSSNPTGGDFDLGSPNSDFGGPGVGSGGRAGQPGQNDTALGNVLIISEDGDQNDPDDNASGGILIFTFDTPKDVLSVDLLDVDANENSVIRAYRADGTLISSTPMNGLGNNSVKTVMVNATDVSRLEVQISGSGAISGLHLCMDGNTVPTDKFCPEEAPADQFGGSGGHAMVWFNVGDFLFQDAMWQEFSDGTARLTGKLTDRDDATRSFGVDVVATGRTMTAPAGSPKKELSAGAYSENGGPVDVSSWKYYTGLTGTLMGMGDFAGASVSIDRRGPAFQVGNGASGKNVQFGGSGWIDLTTTAQPTTGASLPSSGTGDFNLDFKDCVEMDCMIATGDTIGSSNAGGSDSYNNGVWTVSSGGGNWGSSDNIHFVHKKVTGDTEVIARLTSAEDLAQYGRAGLMVRESLASGSKNVAASYYARYDAMQLIKRSSTNGSTGSVGWVDNISTPVWIKLTRVGDVFTHSYSTNGVDYIVVATKTLSMNAMVEVGLYAAGHGWSNVSDYTFDNFTVDGIPVKDDCEPVEPNSASIGDTVWLDQNANGILDGGEAGIAGVTVKLLDANGTQIATDTTDANGNYRFSDLAAGDYTVMVVGNSLPADLVQTFERDGSFDGMTDVNVAAGQDVNDIDYGYMNQNGECGTCAGGVTSVTLKNTKSHALWIKIKQDNAQGDRVVTFDEQVQPGETFTLMGLMSNGTIGQAYWIFIDGVHAGDPITNCSNDVQLGDRVAGGKLEVVAGASKDGGPFCPAPVDMSKGEVGQLTVTQNDAHQWHTVQLDRTYDNPVVIMSMATANSSEPITLRTRNAGSTSFQFQVDEWNYQNGYHPKETINYMVVEAGEYTLANGKKMVAGSTVTANADEVWVNFGTTFASTPVVIAQVGHDNSTDAAVTRIRSISKTGFKVKQQEEEALSGGRPAGTVYYVAIEKGVSGGTMKFEAGNTGDNQDHNWRTTNFGQSYSDPVVFAGMQTTDGGDTAGVRQRWLMDNMVEFKIEEEQSYDSEVSHTSEDIGFFIFQPGLLD